VHTVPDIRMSAQVRHLLGAEMIEHVVAAPLARAHCPVCSAPVPAAGPVNVVLTISGPDQEITFAHLACAPSAVMRGRSRVPTAVSRMAMTAMVVQSGGALLAALVGERKSPAYLHSRTGTDDLVDVGMADALSRGFELIGQLDDVPTRVLEWEATVTDDGSEACHLLIDPPGPFYDGDVLIPPLWREGVEHFGWCVLYTGTGLSDPRTGNLNSDSLLAAVGAGRLAGGRLRLALITAQ
jgi:hypothetical protein